MEEAGKHRIELSVRHILHINITNFFIAVAAALQPRLRSYPVAVVTPGGVRRILLDVSQQARRAGVYKGMLLDSAKRKCPDLVLLNPCPDLYDRARAAVLDEAGRLSPRIEPAGPGHFFIDLTGTTRLWGVAIDSADRLRKSVKDKFSLDSAVGIAQNKLVSKIATRVIKPTGLCEVMAGGEADFMAPLPITYLPGLGRKLAQMLWQLNLRAIGDVISFPEGPFYQAFGQKAVELRELALGVDNSPVRELTAPEPSVHKSYVFEGQTNDDRIIERALFQLVSEGGFALRKMKLAAGKIELSIRYADGVSKQRSLRLDAPASGDLSLYEHFLYLLRKTYTRRIRLSKLAIRLLRLSFPYGQLDLFGRISKERNLMRALDTIKTRFGPQAITFYGRQTHVKSAS